MLQEHILLIGNSDAGLLTSLPVALGGLEQALELIHIHFLGSTVLLEEVELVVVESEPWGGSPHVTVVPVDGSELVNVSQCVLVLGVIELVGDLM